MNITLSSIALVSSLACVGIVLITSGCSKDHKKPSIPMQVLLQEAENNYSDAIIIAHDGKEIASWYKHGTAEKIPVMSITKSIMSLLMGSLIQKGLLAGLDTPLSSFIPEWINTPKEAITIRHILNQTSGLTDYDAHLLFAAKDLATLAEKAPLIIEPGSKYIYTNISYNLLSRVIKTLTGLSVRAYCDQALFAPLGITNYEWDQDEHGNELCFAGLHMYPCDLLKIGELMRLKGVWHGKSLVSSDFIGQMTGPSQPYNPNYGLGCYLIYASTNGNIGYKHGSGSIVGFHPLGYLGQEIVVFPDKKLVGIRVHKRNAEDIEREDQAHKNADMRSILDPLRNPVFFWKFQELLYNVKI